MTQRIRLEPAAIESMIRAAALEDLRHETPAAERERSVARAATALDALCGACDRDGPDAVWDVLEQLDERRLLTFATYAVSELAATKFAADRGVAGSGTADPA
jgi:hypothetical protein